MADLDQVVELDTLVDQGVGQRTAVDTGVGTYLHVIANAHCPELLYLFPACLVTLAIGGKTETIRADHHARMDDASDTDPTGLAQRDTGRQACGLAHRCIRTDVAVAADHRAGINHRTGTDVGHRRHRCAGVQPNAGFDHGTGMNARHRLTSRARRPPLGQARKVEVWVGSDDGRSARQRSFAHAGRDNHTGRRRSRELGAIAWVRQETQAGSIGRLQRRQHRDDSLIITAQFAA